MFVFFDGGSLLCPVECYHIALENLLRARSDHSDDLFVISWSFIGIYSFVTLYI